jgi:hypothetical protein
LGCDAVDWPLRAYGVRRSEDIQEEKEIMIRTLISVDPGLTGTGVVYWTSGVPIKVKVLISPRKEPDEFEGDMTIYRSGWIAQHIREDSPFVVGPATTLVIEMPEFQAGATRIMGWKTGDLQKLTLLVGVISGRLHRMVRDVRLVFPSQWKGQLPKDVVERRLTEHFGVPKVRALGVKTHAWDALGIGLFAHQQTWMKGRG